MITQRSRILVEAAEDYAVSEVELIEMIEKGVCDYYKISDGQLKSKSRKGEFTKARRMYFMLTLNTVQTKQVKLAKNLGQSHCMVSHAKRKLLELGAKWMEKDTAAYDEIDAMVLHMIFQRSRPADKHGNNFLLELGEIMTGIKESCHDESQVEAKDRLLSILHLVYVAEKKGLYDNALGALVGTILQSEYSIHELIPQNIDLSTIRNLNVEASPVISD